MSGKVKEGVMKPKAKQAEVELHVAPRNGKVSREVVAKRGEREFVDELNTSKASAREKFVARLAERWGLDENDAVLAGIEDLLVEKAQEADALAEEAASNTATTPVVDESAMALEQTPEEVREAARAFLESPDFLDELAGDLEKLGIAGEKEL